MGKENRGQGTRGPKVGTINWDEFHKLASYQCTQKEIADFFNISPDTLENYFQDEYGEKLSDFWDKKKGHGRAKLKKIQWEQAEGGSAAMSIWLGKQYLEQSDDTADRYIKEAIELAGLTKEDLLSMIQNKDKIFQATPKKSYLEFCKAAGYAAPFEKQIEMFNFGMNEIGARLLLGARGYGKTDYVVILGLAYQIYLNPLTETNLIITKSKERNASMLREISNACIANGMVFEISNSTCLRVVGLQGKDHSVAAVTIKTVTLRGRHPKRVIMDDPVTEDDVSEATRTHVERVYNEVNKLCGNILIIGQPAHKYDLYAKIRGTVKTLEVPHGTIKELDHDLEAQRLAGVDESSIQASYFLKVLSEGQTPFDKIRYIDVFPTGDSSVAWIDPSFKGTDFTALSIVKSHMQGVAVQGFTYKKAWNHCLDEMVPEFKKYGVKKLAIECNSLGDQPVIMLRQLLQGTGIGVVGVDSVLNKHSKIMAAGSYAHLIHLSKQSSKTYIDQVVKYEYKAKNDDAPDSLASCLEWIGLIRGKR